MGKSLPSTTRLYQLAKKTSNSFRTAKQSKPTSQNPGIGDKSKQQLRLNKEMETESSAKKENNGRLSLSDVVSDCVKRWFKDTLKEAKTGDINMQVLVGQMYYSGYGVPRDAQKVSFLGFFFWIMCLGLVILYAMFGKVTVFVHVHVYTFQILAIQIVC